MWARFLLSKTGAIVIAGVALLGVGLAVDGAAALIGVAGLALVLLGLLKRIDALQARVNLEQGRLFDLGGRVETEKRSAIEHQRRRDEQANEQLRVLGDRLSAVDAKTSALGKNLITVDTKTSALGKNLTSVDTNIGAVNAHLSGLETRLEFTAAELSATDTRVNAGLEAAEARLNAGLEAAETGLTTMGANLHAMDKKLNTVDRNINTVDANVNAIDANLNAVDANLNARVDAVDANLSARVDAVDANLSARVDAVDANLSATVDAVDANLSARVDAVDANLNARVDAVDAKFNTMDTELSAMDMKLSSMDTKLETELEAMGGGLDAADLKLNTVDTKLSSMDLKLNTVDMKASTMDMKASTMDASLNAMDGKLVTLGEGLHDTQSDLTSAQHRTEQLIDQEHRQWTLSVARHRAEQVSRDRILLLLTIHRSGSTMVYDMLRTHPDVDVDPLATTWRSLGLTGRRYPAALSNRPGEVEMEVEEAAGALIPEIPRFGGWKGSLRWMIEKAHPQFIQFEADRLANRLAALRSSGTEVRVAYVVRRPLDVLWSFHEYKTRDPAWQAVLATEQLPDFILRAYRTLAEVYRKEPSPVLDYSLHRDPSGPLAHLAGELSGEVNPSDIAAWHAFACATTDRNSRREQIGGPFLGDADPERHVDGPDGVWRPYRAVIDETTRIWSELVGRGSLY